MLYWLQFSLICTMVMTFVFGILIPFSSNLDLIKNIYVNLYYHGMFQWIFIYSTNKFVLQHHIKIYTWNKTKYIYQKQQVKLAVRSGLLAVKVVLTYMLDPKFCWHCKINVNATEYTTLGCQASIYVPLPIWPKPLDFCPMESVHTLHFLPFYQSLGC